MWFVVCQLNWFTARWPGSSAENTSFASWTKATSQWENLIQTHFHLSIGYRKHCLSLRIHHIFRRLIPEISPYHTCCHLTQLHMFPLYVDVCLRLLHSAYRMTVNRSLQHRMPIDLSDVPRKVGCDNRLQIFAITEESDMTRPATQ